MDEHVLPTYKRAPEVFVDGTGAVLIDQDGREYLDFLAGIAVSALGHRHPGLVAALQDQVAHLIHTSNLFRHPYTEQVAASVARLSGRDTRHGSTRSRYRRTPLVSCPGLIDNN